MLQITTIRLAGISNAAHYLFMDKKYWLEDEAQERINIPGTVTKFNWTYRLPVAVEDLQKNQKFIDTINKITKRS